MHATTDTELLDVLGPFLLIEQHVDIDVTRGRDEHLTRRGVLDVRDGHQVSVADLVGAQPAAEVHRQAQRLLASALDSIRRANDERARRAATALTGFSFDSLSFTLIADDGAPAVAFLVPGRGPRAGGYALPLPPLRITPGPWWPSIRRALLQPSDDAQAWRGATYEVVAREDSTGEGATLSLRVAPDEWTVAHLPLPVRYVQRLDEDSIGAETIAALRRAFDEAARYSGEVKTAAVRRAPTALAADNRMIGTFFPLMRGRPQAFLQGACAPRLVCRGTWRPA